MKNRDGRTPETDGVVSRIEVLVKPRASRDSIEGWKEGTLLVRLTSPPVEGAANESLRKLLAKALKVPRGSVRIVTGERTRNKVVQIAGVSPEGIRERLR